MNEIRVLASIKHRNIVRYCDAFVEKDSLYIAMEFAEHGDIGRQIEKFKKANKYIKEDTVWAYLVQITQGLQAMHSRNVLHRDLKPKNVRHVRWLLYGSRWRNRPRAGLKQFSLVATHAVQFSPSDLPHGQEPCALRRPGLR